MNFKTKVHMEMMSTCFKDWVKCQGPVFRNTIYWKFQFVRRSNLCSSLMRIKTSHCKDSLLDVLCSPNNAVGTCVHTPRN